VALAWYYLLATKAATLVAITAGFRVLYVLEFAGVYVGECSPHAVVGLAATSRASI
jgi:hypothetical protein